ncbi:unnamed protein product, partial [Timema podura]|nr:unnamed protein product [Timema podura]
MKSTNTSPRDSPQTRRRCSLPEASDIRESILERLKCRVCLELMQSPVHQCSNGHSICPSCYPQY